VPVLITTFDVVSNVRVLVQLFRQRGQVNFLMLTIIFSGKDFWIRITMMAFAIWTKIERERVITIAKQVA